jgi:hypothetical protein
VLHCYETLYRKNSWYNLRRKNKFKFLVENQKKLFEIDILKSKRYLSCTEKIKVNEFPKKDVERVSMT